MSLPSWLDLVRVTTPTVGAGTTIALGAAVNGYLTPAQAGAVNGTLYRIAFQDGNNSQIGTATYNAGSDEFTGLSITSSTNGGSPISLSGKAEIISCASELDLAGFLQAANNLSDVASAATARSNLGLGSAAVLAAATFLAVSNNLSDVASAATARTNLGLGTAAVESVAAFLQPSNNLSDVASAGTARTNLGLGSIATQSAAAVAITGGSITGLGTPVNASDAATKSYVDATAQGLSVKPSAICATTAALPTYSYAGGVITFSATGAVTIDGHLLALNDVVLVLDETGGNAPYNGLYTVTTAPASGVAGVLTRNANMNTGAEFPGAFVFVEAGTVNASAGFVCTNTGTVTVGTTAIGFQQFSGAGEILAGTGLSKSGNALSISASYVGQSSITTLGTITAGVWNGTAIGASYLPGSFSGFANPSNAIGLTANNGSATTAMRSDATPALSQAISPTWTGPHLFENFVYFAGGGAGVYPATTTYAAFGANFSNGDIEVDVWNTNPAGTYTNTGIRFLQYLTSSSYRDLMFIHNAGRVGIGTSSFTSPPLSTLDVYGGVAVGAYAGVEAAPSNGLIVSGQVGIGTALPATSTGLHIYSAGVIGEIVQSGSVYAGLIADYSNFSSLLWSSGTPITFGTITSTSFSGYDELMRISAAGGLSLGSSTDPGAGNLLVNSASSANGNPIASFYQPNLPSGDVTYLGFGQNNTGAAEVLFGYVYSSTAADNYLNITIRGGSSAANFWYSGGVSIGAVYDPGTGCLFVENNINANGNLVTAGNITSLAGMASILVNVGGLTWAQLDTGFYDLSLGGNGRGTFAWAWNYSGGQGEVDLFVNEGAGGGGGLRVYQFPNTTGAIVPILAITGVGSLVLPQYATPGMLGITTSAGALGQGQVIAGGYVTPQMYGCAGNGTTDDTTNLSTCLNSGYPVLLIGKFKISSQITVTLNDSSGPFGLNIVGAGPMLSQILLTTQTAGVTADASYSGNGNTNTQVVLKDFSLVAEYAGVGSSTVGALNVIGSPQIGSGVSNYRIENITGTTNSVGTNYAFVGIFLKDVRNGWVRDCNLVGLAYNTANTSGIVFTSSDNGATGNAPCDVNFDACHIVSFDKGIELRASGDTNHSYQNDWQGVHIDGCTILSCSYDIYANSTDVNANGLTITNCITSFFVNAVHINNVQGFNIANNYWENLGGNSITFVVATIGTTAAVCLGTYTGNTHFNAPYTGGTAISATASGSGVMKCVATGNVSYGSGAMSLTYTVTSGSNNA